MANFYVYAHKKKTDNSVFYIGKGSGSRAFATHGRGDYWTKVVAKHGRSVDIIADGLSEAEAFELEELLIAEIGRRDLGLGTLINLTDGGDGSSGLRHTDEFRKKISAVHKGKKYRLGQKASDDTKLKMSRAQKGKVLSDEHKRNISESHKAKGISAENRAALTAARSRPIMNLCTGEVFGMLKDAAKSCGGTSSNIRRAAISGSTCAGFKWRYLDG